MVSKVNEDLPDPLSPVITVRVLRGMATSMFFRLCWRAPCTEMRSSISYLKIVLLQIHLIVARLVRYRKLRYNKLG
jgi:hypothetical protein